MNCFRVTRLRRLRRMIVPVSNECFAPNSGNLGTVMSPFYGFEARISSRSIRWGANSCLLLKAHSYAGYLLCSCYAVRAFKKVFTCVAISAITNHVFARVTWRGTTTTSVYFHVLLRTLRFFRISTLLSTIHYRFDRRGRINR